MLVSTLDTPTALRLLAVRARTAVTTAATPHLRRAYNGLTGELTAWHAAHGAEQAARVDAELDATRERRNTARIVDALQREVGAGQQQGIALGALLAMPAVRDAIGDDRWRYFRAKYARQAVEADEGVAA